MRCQNTACNPLFLMNLQGEHALSMAVDVSQPGNSDVSWLSLYVRNTHSFVLSTPLVPTFTPWVSALVLVASIAATAAWNLNDLLLILIATGLRELLRAVNKQVEAAATAAACEEEEDPCTQVLHSKWPSWMHSSASQEFDPEWHRLRQLFATAAAFVHEVDKIIAGLVLISFANNLYFICLQLLNGISWASSGSGLSAVYFLLSFVFLLWRASWVTLAAASVHDESRAAAPALYTTPRLDIEAQRLLHQICTDDIVLTGMRFFSITRNFMLGVAGAIVTYEVVLLQFHIQQPELLNGTDID